MLEDMCHALGLTGPVQGIVQQEAVQLPSQDQA